MEHDQEGVVIKMVYYFSRTHNSCRNVHDTLHIIMGQSIWILRKKLLMMPCLEIVATAKTLGVESVAMINRCSSDACDPPGANAI